MKDSLAYAGQSDLLYMVDYVFSCLTFCVWFVLFFCLPQDIHLLILHKKQTFPTEDILFQHAVLYV